MDFRALSGRISESLSIWGPGLVESSSPDKDSLLRAWIEDMDHRLQPGHANADARPFWEETVRPAAVASCEAVEANGDARGPIRDLHITISEAVLAPALVATLPFADELDRAFRAPWKGLGDAEWGNRLHTVWALDALHRMRGQAHGWPGVKQFCDKGKEITRKLEACILSDLGLVAQEAKLPVVELMYCLVLYHDIGRAISEERHATHGYNLLVILSPPDERQRLRDFFETGRQTGASQPHGRDETEEPGDSILRLFTRLMRYHDLTGTIVNGEASLAALGQALKPEETKPAAHRLLLTALCLVNIADYAAGWFRPFEQPADFHERIALYLGKLGEALAAFPSGEHLSREEVRASLLRRARGETAVIDRIEDLAKTSHFSCTRGHIADALALVPVGDSEAFYQGVASIAKLDYGKRFFDELAKRLNVEAAAEECPPERQAEALVRILYRISRRYSGFAQQQGLIGIDMTKLDPGKPDTEKILDLFVRDPDRALVAIEDTVSAFPFA